MTKGRKGSTAGVIVVLVIIGLLAFIAYKVAFPTGFTIKGVVEPKLSVSGVSLDSSWGLSKGCASIVTGHISNTGNANAEGVVVNCRLIGTKGSRSDSRNLGSVSSGGSSYFSMNINNDCPNPNDVECAATCSNCK